MKIIDEIIKLESEQLNAAPGTDMDALRRRHDELSAKLRILRQQRSGIQQLLNGYDAETTAHWNNGAMSSIARILGDTVGYGHLLPPDSSHPKYTEWL